VIITWLVRDRWRQDASTSSLVWVFHLLAEHPDVLARVREEQYRLRPNDEPIDFELLSNMTYTRQVRCPFSIFMHSRRSMLL
jgi:cytochrome P450